VRGYKTSHSSKFQVRHKPSMVLRGVAQMTSQIRTRMRKLQSNPHIYPKKKKKKIAHTTQNFDQRLNQVNIIVMENTHQLLCSHWPPTPVTKATTRSLQRIGSAIANCFRSRLKMAWSSWLPLAIVVSAKSAVRGLLQ
jgi:hypothetical protein